MVAYRSNKNMVFSCKYHVIWCPKYRYPVLRGPAGRRLEAIVRAVVVEMRCDLLELEVMPDHVHLLVEVDPQLGVHRLIQRLKGRSARLLRREFPWLRRMPTLWTNSSFVSTVGGAPPAVVKRYIESQKDAA